MARTIKEIENEILAAKEADSNLDSLTSTSKTAIWRLWVYIIAFAIWVHESLWDVFKKEAEATILASHPHNFRWYRDVSLRFRDGKSLYWDGAAFSWPALVGSETLEDLEIVKQAAVVESPGKLIIKVAKEDSGSLTKLSDPEKTRFTTYINSIKDAGNTIEVISEDPDDVKITATIYCDPLLIDLSDGSLVADSGVKPVEDAINAYLNSDELNFNGELRRTHLIDAMQNATGVNDPILTSLQTRYAAEPFAEIEEGVVPYSGYFAVDTLTLTYKAYGE